MPESKALRYALRYQQLGWSVIPLQTTGENAKRPAVEWLEYQDHAADEQQIRDWWEKEDYNVGIVTGSVSRLIVIDLDGPNALALLEREGLAIPESAYVQTGKGFHCYLRYSGGDIGSGAKLLTDGKSSVDVRGEGGYVVAPPSIHPTGRRYIWTATPPKLVDLPVDLEQWLLEVAGRTSGVKAAAIGAQIDDVELPNLLSGVEEGARNDAAARVSGYWLRVCHSDLPAAWSATQLWNAQNKPPLTEKELRTTFNSIVKADTRRKAAEAAKELPRIKVVEGEEWAQELEAAKPRQGLTISTPGIPDVGGLVPGDFIVIAGRPGVGKSAFACQLAADACLRRGYSTLIISTEMSRIVWGYWMAAAAGPCAVSQLPHPLPKAYSDLFATAPIGIIDVGSIQMKEITSIARGRLGVQLIIIDHIGRIGTRQQKSRELEVGQVARECKALARDTNAVVVGLCQLNRGLEHREDKRPMLSDLRDSGQIEQEADSVFFLWVEKGKGMMGVEREVLLTLQKNRFGPNSELKLKFKAAERRFV